MLGSQKSLPFFHFLFRHVSTTLVKSGQTGAAERPFWHETMSVLMCGCIYIYICIVFVIDNGIYKGQFAKVNGKTLQILKTLILPVTSSAHKQSFHTLILCREDFDLLTLVQTFEEGLSIKSETLLENPPTVSKMN